MSEDHSIPRARRSLSIVIPALDERDTIESVITGVPVDALEYQGYDVEILVVDNGSTDGTGDIARQCGARVVNQPIRGYGSAYKAGFSNCTGELMAAADADLTYPVEMLPELLELMESQKVDFLSTDRLAGELESVMSTSHQWGNRALTAASRALFLAPFRDSQSGMWVLRREVWEQVRVQSNGMAFSQELKHEAFARGFRCAEVPIPYRARGGERKLRTFRDGALNAGALLAHRMRLLVPGHDRAPAWTAPVATAPIVSLREIDLREPWSVGTGIPHSPRLSR